ncbi:putative protocadherin-23 [Scophthalmus maximus]|uniref:Putative protocadherin-23 n=1 Tax=Scophthalmus maximus TaxID=52904 RepID=A0A2U9CPC8_SCOMX|nr:putative protocadherin-23 [Scophthalmus maximus]KAF0032293.1 hypothetical protein F2P81_014583 [Scophthalmus maximus]
MVQSVTRSPQHSAFLHQRRRRRPSTPTAPSAVKAFVFQRSRSPVPAADLPVASRRPPSAEDQLTCTAVNPDEPLLVHKHSVEEYQQIYHEAVDDVLRNGRVPPYSLHLGRQIKEKLWERLARPAFAATTDDGGHVHVGVSYGAGASPPHYDIDTSLEPEPKPVAPEHES